MKQIIFGVAVVTLLFNSLTLNYIYAQINIQLSETTQQNLLNIQTLNTKKTDLEKETGALKHQISEKQSKVKRLLEQQDTTQKQVKKEIQDLKEAVAELEQALMDKRNELKKTNEELNAYESI